MIKENGGVKQKRDYVFKKEICPHTDLNDGPLHGKLFCSFLFLPKRKGNFGIDYKCNALPTEL